MSEDEIQPMMFAVLLFLSIVYATTFAMILGSCQ